MVGATGLLLLPTWLMLFGTAGLPISLPPLPEDPVMARVAPQECLWYLSCSGMAPADPASKNQTEQLLAEEEIQQFAHAIEQAIVGQIRADARGHEGTVAAEEIPKLVKIALTRPLAVFLSDVKIAPHGPDIQGGLIVNLGDRSDEASQALDRLQSLIGNSAATDKWHRLPLPADAPVIEWGVREKYLIVGVGADSADGVVARMQGTAPDWLKGIREKLPVERPATVQFLNIKKILSLATAAGAFAEGSSKNVVSGLGLDHLAYLASASGLERSGATSKMLLAMEGPPTGIFALAGGKPLSAQELTPIPSDATFALASRLDLDKLYKGVLDIVGNVDASARRRMEDGISRAERQLGVKLSQDLLQSLGDCWCVYCSPAEGGLMGLGVTAVVPVRDRKRLVAAEDRLLQIARASLKEQQEESRGGRGLEGPAIADCEFRGVRIYYVKSLGPFVPIAPAWCITDKELVVAMSPQSLKAYLSRAAGAASLADVPAVKRQFEAGEGPTWLAYVDTAAVARTIYPIVQLAFESFSQSPGERIPLDPASFPSAAAILPHLQPSVVTARGTKAGLLIVQEGSLPASWESIPFVAMPLWLYGDGQHYVRPRAAAQMESSNNLKQIALAMHNYHSDKGMFPSATGAGEDGKPLLSWRVHLLPYMEQQALYSEFHLDEPWDSEHNKKLIPRMPRVYAAPGSKVAGQFKTVYLVPRGDDTIFPHGRQISIEQVKDGLSNTLLVVEASDSRAVIWTKPDDYEVDYKHPMAGLVGLRSGGFLAAFADGAVVLLKDTIKDETMKALFTRAGGEVVNRAELP